MSSEKQMKNLDTLTEGMRPQDAAFIKRGFSRRSLMKGAAAVGAGAFAWGPGGLMDAMAQTPAAMATPVPLTLADDAAPMEQQLYRVTSDPAFAKSLDFYETVYNRAGGADLSSVPLVRIDRNFEIIPGAAESWSGSEDGKEWTFKLRPGIVWSDGNPVTAADWVKTFQYSADPEHAWDFTWFWSGNIVNYTEAVAGTVKPEEIGVTQGANELEVVFKTIDPAPYLPAKLLYSLPLSKAALEAHGAFYNNNPATAVSSGPFIIDEWVPDQYVALKRNEAFNYPFAVPIQRIVAKLAASNTVFTMYQAGEIDTMEGMAPADLQLVKADPDLSKQLYQGVGDFACYYLFFDVTKAPFDNLKVRQAFSHAVDRDAMQKAIWDTQAIPAPSYLAPGFPASDVEGLQDIQKYDPDMAKQLLSEAGYPDGKDFPKLVISQRGGAAPLEVATVQAWGTMINDNLGIPTEIQTVDRQAFYNDMKSIQCGFVSYGMDYLDPSNMLGVWLSGGRHSWSNADFDKAVKDATVFLGDSDERIAMFKAAEKILVEDVPAAFTFFIKPNQLAKPYMKGHALEPDNSGITAIHWPGYASMSTVPEELYIGSDAPSDRS
ncbi:MAG: peptide ABC transporter substrate-binding protein [Thermomicrobiales bacterium]